MSDIELPADPAAELAADPAAELAADPAAEVAELVRAIAGVRGVYGARPALVGAVVRVAKRAEPSPVVLTVTAEQVRVAVEIAVSAAGTAPTTARAVGDAVHAWCVDTYPLLRPEVAIRVSFVE